MARRLHYPRSSYRVNYKKYEPYYSCPDCGEKFHDSNPLVEHRRSCRFKGVSSNGKTT